jgi:hypothetical protein
VDLPLGGFLQTVLAGWGVGHGLAGVNGGGHLMPWVSSQ